jgi:hypothetical protein
LLAGARRHRIRPMKRAVLLAFAGLLLSAVTGVAAPSAPPGKDKDKDEMGTVAGTPVERAQGGWLGIELKDNCFRLTFYNEKKKPTPADVSSAVFWWPVRYQPNAERTQLLPTDDPAVFASPYPVKAPHTFILHIVLLKADKPDTSEAYVINYSG